MTVGERIKQRREYLGYSQEELAKIMGYSGKSSVCKAETSGDSVTTTKISKFAKALNTTPAYLMGWDDEPITMDIEVNKSQELLDLWENATDSAKESVLILLRNSQKRGD